MDKDVTEDRLKSNFTTEELARLGKIYPVHDDLVKALEQFHEHKKNPKVGPNELKAFKSMLFEADNVEDAEDEDAEDEDEDEDDGGYDEPDGNCRWCGSDKFDEVGNEMLLCDRCDAEYHLQCLDPVLDEVPEGEWLCPDCVEKKNPELLEIETFCTRLNVLRMQMVEYEATKKRADILDDEKFEILGAVLKNQGSSVSNEEFRRRGGFQKTFEEKYWSLFEPSQWPPKRVIQVNEMQELCPEKYAKFQEDRKMLRKKYLKFKDTVYGEKGFEQIMRELMKTNPFFKEPTKHEQELKSLLSELAETDLTDEEWKQAQEKLKEVKKRKGLGGFPV